MGDGAARSVRPTPPSSLPPMLPPLLMGMPVITDMVFLMAAFMVMDSPFSPHPPPPLNPQLPMPERNVRPMLNLRLMPLLMLIMVITVTPDTTVDTADTMVDTTAVDTDTDTADTTDGANREIQCKTLILKERKNNCHRTKLNQKTAAT